MVAKSFKLIAVLAFAVVLCAASGVQAQAAEKDAVVVKDVKSYGNQVVVTVANLSQVPVECKVAVTAMSGLMPVRATAMVQVNPGATAQIPVGFEAFVSNVIVVGISDGADPVM
jgi:hypothetical protein